MAGLQEGEGGRPDGVAPYHQAGYLQRVRRCEAHLNAMSGPFWSTAHSSPFSFLPFSPAPQGPRRAAHAPPATSTRRGARLAPEAPGLALPLVRSAHREPPVLTVPALPLRAVGRRRVPPPCHRLSPKRPIRRAARPLVSSSGFAPRLRRGTLSGMKVRNLLKRLKADGWYCMNARRAPPVQAPDQAGPCHCLREAEPRSAARHPEQHPQAGGLAAVRRA